MLNKDELDFFELFIILSYTRATLESDLKALSVTSFKLKEPYKNFIHSMLNKLSQDLFKVKIQLKQRKMSIEQIENDGTFTSFNCYCGGYVHTSRFLNNHLKNKVREKLNEIFIN
ncbi:MAG: hypothetical protein LRY71_07040 [Bacillaceae bacterium]|nr:hypothetical protein [Bacillaceae bacterium]